MDRKGNVALYSYPWKLNLTFTVSLTAVSPIRGMEKYKPTALHKTPEIKRDKTIADKLLYINYNETQNFPFSRLQLVVKLLDSTLWVKIQVPKVVEQTNNKYKTLGTSAINSPMSPSSLMKPPTLPGMASRPCGRACVSWGFVWWWELYGRCRTQLGPASNLEHLLLKLSDVERCGYRQGYDTHRFFSS